MDYIKYIRNLVGHEKVFLCCTGAVIYNEKNEILLQHRTDTNNWGMLGGSLNFDETVKEAVAREVQEEAMMRIDVEKLALLGIYANYPFIYPNGDEAQIIALAFTYPIAKNETFAINDDEGYALAFFNETNLPPLMNKQTEDVIADFFKNKNEIYLR